MTNTTILRCEGCKPHEFQDQTYGDRRRVANRIRQAALPPSNVFRCTVCSKHLHPGGEKA